MKKYYLSLLFILSFIIAMPALAADFYVDGDNGSDVIGDGSEEAPYKTVTKAVSVMAGSDTIYCKGTIADGSITLTNALSGTAAAYTTITAWPDNEPVIDATGNASAFILGQVNYLKIANLSVTGATIYGIYGSGGGLSEYIEISNNRIYGLPAGVMVLPIYFENSSYLTIAGNEIYGDGNDNYGIGLLTVTNSVIERNKIHDFIRLAIGIDGDCSLVTIKNNLIYNIIGDALYSWNSGLVISESTQTAIYNNSIYNTYNNAVNVSGIVILSIGGGATNDITVKNNIIHMANYGIIISNDTRTGFSSDYNDFYNVATIGYWDSANQTTLEDWQTAANSDRHSIITDPLFSSTTAGLEDFHLQDSSLCIDAGQNNSGLTDDYDNEPRPYNIADIGADERPVFSVSPSGLSAEPAVKNADISWKIDSSYSATGYNIKIGKEDDLSDGVISSLSTVATTINIASLMPAQKYYYAVQAVYATSYQEYLSDYSGIASFYTYPKKVTKVKVPATKINSTIVRAKWKKQKRVTEFTIKLMDKDKDLVRYISINSSDHASDITNLMPGKKYKIKVRSENKVGQIIYVSKWSKTKTFRTIN